VPFWAFSLSLSPMHFAILVSKAPLPCCLLFLHTPVLPLPPSVAHCTLSVANYSRPYALELHPEPFLWPWPTSLAFGTVLVNSPTTLPLGTVPCTHLAFSSSRVVHGIVSVINNFLHVSYKLILCPEGPSLSLAHR